MKLHFTAAEASGDLLAAETIDALSARNPNIVFSGIGGDELAARGIQSPFDIAPLSVLGLIEGLKAYGTVIELADQAAEHIISAAPDAAVLVDSWGFCLRVGQRVRRRAPDIRLIKLAGPQIWATRPGRAKTLAATFDQVLCLHRMELPYYDALDIRADLIGVPALSRTEIGDGAAFRQRHGLAADRPVVLILPGSRRSEMANVAPTLVEAAARIKTARPDVQLLAAPAPQVADLFDTIVGNQPDIIVCADSDQRYDAMAAADLALACSGTVTSELAVQGVPMLVAYKLGWMTWTVAKTLLYKHRHITLFNIADGDRSIAPEFVQGDMTPDAIAACAIALLDDPAARLAQADAQTQALQRMGFGEESATSRAAAAILDGLGRKTP